MKLLSFLLFLLLGINSQLQAQVPIFSYEKFINPDGDSLNYRLLYPDYNKSRLYPLVIFLHGSGERGNDNNAQLKWGVMNFASDQMMKMYPSFVIAPQCPENMDWANAIQKKDEIFLNPEPGKTTLVLMELIKDLMIKFPIDPKRIYITGLSMGASGTFDIIQRYPDMFAAAVPVCGRGDVSKAGLIKHIPMWIFHGAEDPGIDPVYSLNMVAALTKAGGHPGYTQYPEVGHFCWLAAYSDPMMMQWLFRQHK